jgi:hypothetical protein
VLIGLLLLSAFARTEISITEARAVPYSENGKLVGFKVMQILPESSMGKLGFQVDDIVVTRDGKLPGMGPGDKVEIIRAGKKRKVTLPIRLPSVPGKTRERSVDEMPRYMDGDLRGPVREVE